MDTPAYRAQQAHHALLSHGITAPAAAYAVGGRRFAHDAPGLADAIADAYAAHWRPLCLCRDPGLPMYVARLAGSSGGYILKRMPETGPLHAPDCPSYEPPPELSGLGQMLGSAITEDPATGETTLKLDFALSRIAGRSQMPPAGGDSDSVCTDGTKLSLRGLLHYLWDQAELTRWHPGFAGKRHWGTVRRHLLQAAAHKVARGDPLLSRLYIPEVFSVGQRDAINARRQAFWARAIAAPGKPQPLMLLIGEVKEIVPARYGFKAVIKHLPDQGFAVDEQLYRRLGRRFEVELALWGATDDLHMVVIGVLNVRAGGVAMLQELSLMPVTRQWLPVANGLEAQLVERLVAEGRVFTKGLRYQLGAGAEVAAAVLLDAGPEPCALRLVCGDDGDEAADGHDPTDAGGGQDCWIWHADQSPMPPLPPSSRPGRPGGDASSPHQAAEPGPMP